MWEKIAGFNQNQYLEWVNHVRGGGLPYVLRSEADKLLGRTRVTWGGPLKKKKGTRQRPTNHALWVPLRREPHVQTCVIGQDGNFHK